MHEIARRAPTLHIAKHRHRFKAGPDDLIGER
jgi:hypothetical protein